MKHLGRIGPDMKYIVQAQKEAALENGRAWWFAPDAIEFFDSKIEAGPFHNPGADPYKHYFVTSEQCHFSDGDSAPRKYSVRIWTSLEPAQIRTWGKFQQFRTKEAAVKVATLLGVYGKLAAEHVPDEDD